MRAMGTKLLAGLLTFAAPLTAKAATFYVSPTGSDTAAGTQAAPFASWARAQTAAAPGDTVYFRGGTYTYTDATTTCGGSMTATVNAVVLSKSGTAGNPIHYWAFPGEAPIFDFSGITDTTKYNCRQTGVRVEADWLYLKGLELKGTLQLNNVNHESWCVYVAGGNNNVFDQLNAHHNMGPGFFVQTGGDNTFLNCDSHENEDTLTSNGDGQSADGFGCHPNKTGNTGNLFHGCRAWWNSDDSWDFINATEACTVEYSWAWYAGYKPDALTNGAPVALAAGNGNGFKGGGYGDPQTNVPTPTPQHVIRLNAAFYNKANGLYANHEIVNPFFYNNTSFNNGVDVDMLGLDGTTTTSVGMLRNNLAYSNNGHTLLSDLTNGGPISDEFNSWDTTLNIKVADADFQSVTFTPPKSCPAAYAPGGTSCCAPTDMTCFSGLASARQADGSLPVLPFLRLATNSPLIDKGTNVGLPFSGAAPDLGCFESGLTFDQGDGGTTPIPDGGGGGTTDSGAGGGTRDSGTTTATDSGGGTTVGSDSGGGGVTTEDAGGTVASDDGGGTAVEPDGAVVSTGGSDAGRGTTGTGSTGTGSTGSDSGTKTASADGSTSTSAGADGGSGADSNSGCGCRVAPIGANRGGALLLGLGLLGLFVRRRSSRG